MKRLGKIAKILLFLTACLATLIFLFFNFESWRGHRAWKHYKAEVERRGENLDPKSVIPRPIPDSSNFAAIPLFTERFVTNDIATERPSFATLLSQFKTALDIAGKPPVAVPVTNSLVRTQIRLRALLAALKYPQASGVSQAHASEMEERLGTGTNRATLAIDTNLPLTEIAQAVLAELKAYDPILNQVEEAQQRPFARFPIDYEKMPFTILLPHLAPMRSTAQLLSARATARLAAGQGDLALQDLRLIWRLADSIQDEPFLISYLVRLGLLNLSLEPLATGLSAGLWSEPQLASFQQNLFDINLVQENLDAIHAEIVYCGLNGIDYLRRSPASGEQVVEGPNVAKAFPGGWFYLEMINYHRLAGLIDGACNPREKTIDPTVAKKADADMNDELNGPTVKLVINHTFWARQMLPALTGLTMRTANSQAGLSLAGLACALERYRLAHGQYPDSLADLQPLLNGQQGRDVIGGGSLHYQRETPASYVAYSIGWNETDDHGRVEFKLKGEREPIGGDWVWRPMPAP